VQILYWWVSDRYVILVVFKEASVVLCLVTQTSCVLYVMRETSSLTGKIRKVVSKRYFHKMLFWILSLQRIASILVDTLLLSYRTGTMYSFESDYMQKHLFCFFFSPPLSIFPPSVFMHHIFL